MLYLKSDVRSFDHPEDCENVIGNDWPIQTDAPLEVS
jgi:hypothetical protein